MKAPEAYPLGYVEDAFEARTPHREERWGWAGENRGFFSSQPPRYLSLIYNLGTLGSLQRRDRPLAGRMIT
jgi:hypothetical protein